MRPIERFHVVRIEPRPDERHRHERRPAMHERDDARRVLRAQAPRRHSRHSADVHRSNLTRGSSHAYNRSTTSPMTISTAE